MDKMRQIKPSEGAQVTMTSLGFKSRMIYTTRKIPHKAPVSRQKSFLSIFERNKNKSAPGITRRKRG